MHTKIVLRCMGKVLLSSNGVGQGQVARVHIADLVNAKCGTALVGLVHLEIGGHGVELEVVMEAHAIERYEIPYGVATKNNRMSR